jgi:hypothetical protein
LHGTQLYIDFIARDTIQFGYQDCCMQYQSFANRGRKRLALVGLILSPAMAMATPVTDGNVSRRQVSIHAGAYAPLFFIYETPGFAMSADVAWRIGDDISTDVTATASAIAASGLRRYAGVVTAGGRYHVSPAVWLRVGMGVAGYRERIAVNLANRSVRAIDYGAALVISTGVGVDLGRWHGEARFDPNVVNGRGMDFVGTALLLLGRKL